MTDRRPWRRVTESTWRSGRGSFLGPDTTRRVRWWYLTLECGHEETRVCKYGPHRDGYPRQRGGTQHRLAEDMLPPPKRVRCDDCGREGRP